MTTLVTRIVLVDDHQMLQDGLRMLLAAEEDFEVVGVANDCDTALRLVDELQPDVVVMDRHLPGVDGIYATRQIRTRQPGVKVIGLTGDSNSSVAAEWIRAGASGYVQKRVAGEELKTAIRAALHGNVYLSHETLGAMVDAANGAGGRVRRLLSPRELEVLELIVVGRSTKQSARELNVSVKTIETHRRNLMAKLELDNVAELTRYAIREGISAL